MKLAIEYFDFYLDFLSFCKIVDCFCMIFRDKLLFFVKSGLFLLYKFSKKYFCPQIKFKNHG